MDAQPETKERRARNSFFEKARKTAGDYSKATGMTVLVLSAEALPAAESLADTLWSEGACACCVNSSGEPDPQELRHNPCWPLHAKALEDAAKICGSRIYMCELGFMFWISPIYNEGRLAGGLLGMGLLGMEPEEGALNFSALNGGQVSPEAFAGHLSRFPRDGGERLKALSEQLEVCAESLSQGPLEYQYTLKRRAEQQAELALEIEELRARGPGDLKYPPYSLETERELLAAVRSGEESRGAKILSRILAVLLFTMPGDFDYLQCRAMELVALLSRSALENGATEDMILETNNIFLKNIAEADSIEELTDELHRLIRHMTDRVFAFQGLRHAAALKRAEQYIQQHYSGRMVLKDIAEASGLSAPYFSTIFKEEMGENLSSYINRLRVEKARRLLLETKRSLSDISVSCGFEDQSWFSKIFKHYTGVSPGKYRVRGDGEVSEQNFSAAYRNLQKKNGKV